MRRVRTSATAAVLFAALVACAMPGAPEVDRCIDAVWQAGGTPADRALRQKLADGIQRLARDRATATISTLGKPDPDAGPRIEMAPRRSDSRTPEAIYGDFADAVVVVGRLYKCKKCPRQHLTTSTGFFVSRTGAFVTNAHVLDGGPDDPLAILTRDGKVHPIGPLLAFDKGRDIAVVQAKGAGFTPLSINPEPRVGSTVHVISHPASHYFVFTSGVVARAATGDRSLRGIFCGVSAVLFAALGGFLWVGVASILCNGSHPARLAT